MKERNQSYGYTSTHMRNVAKYNGYIDVRLYKSESESELFTSNTLKDNHLSGPVIGDAGPLPLQEKQIW